MENIKALIICIEMLIGHYYIEIHDSYVFKYWVPLDTQVSTDLSIVDLRTDDVFLVTKDFELEKVPPRTQVLEPPTKDWLKEIVATEQPYLEYMCDVYKLSDIHNSSEFAMILEERLTDVPIIHKYLPAEKNKHRIMFVGSEYKSLKKYVLSCYDVRHREKMLMYKVNSIEEEDEPSQEMQTLIQKIQHLEK